MSFDEHIGAPIHSAEKIAILNKFGHHLMAPFL